MLSHKFRSWFIKAGFEPNQAEEYSKLFEDQFLEHDQIKLLDHNLLKEIGISSVGHRLKILKRAHERKSLVERIEESVSFLKVKEKSVPAFGIIIGFGMENVFDRMENIRKITYEEVPHFPLTTTEEGALIIGTLGSKKIVVLKGRQYYYEGLCSADIVYPVQVLKAWGLQKLFICSPVSSLKANINPGDIVFIDNHINLIPNPLIGPNDPTFSPRSPHGKDPYHLEGNTLGLSIAKKHNIAAHRGVYIAITGPSGSTRAELRAWVTLGADILGYSIAPEVVACMHSKLRVVALGVVVESVIPNQSHEVPDEECLRIASETAPKVITLLTELLQSEQKSKTNKFIQQGEGLVLHGNRYYHKQNYTKALEFYGQALEKEDYQPAIWNIHNRLSATHSRLKEHHSALEQAEHMIRLKPEHPKGYLRRGGAYFFIGKYELALQDYMKAKTLNEQGNGEDINSDNLEKYIDQAKKFLIQSK